MWLIIGENMVKITSFLLIFSAICLWENISFGWREKNGI
jgi:hypothetical protein